MGKILNAVKLMRNLSSNYRILINRLNKARILKLSLYKML